MNINALAFFEKRLPLNESGDIVNSSFAFQNTY